MDYNDLLKSLLTDKQIKQLNTALREGKAIIITGISGPAGKSTLKDILNKKGYRAYEKFETFELELNQIIQKPIPNIESQIE